VPEPTPSVTSVDTGAETRDAGALHASVALGFGGAELGLVLGSLPAAVAGLSPFGRTSSTYSSSRRRRRGHVDPPRLSS